MHCYQCLLLHSRFQIAVVFTGYRDVETIGKNREQSTHIPILCTTHYYHVHITRLDLHMLQIIVNTINVKCKLHSLDHNYYGYLPILSDLIRIKLYPK